ncbi:LacI family DNA-binding transcriptional regulator [Anaerobacillus sp. MEB173]|uniref:LacI family DNA-binding transcriptional regulator n=1 Tax=Anaerobacillus sp. MEB173 TaxID=3383345 RepID=UPI003F939719
MVKKKVTAMDVAKLAGVSQPTVSRVFGSGANVSEGKRQRILEAAEKLGYQPNAIARGLTTNKTQMVGIVMKDIQNPFYPEVLERFYKELAKRGYHLLFINSDNDQVEENEISKLIEYNVEGVIITDALLSSSAAARFIRNDIVVVLFNRYIQDNYYSAVYCDNYSAGYEIGQYLIELGHRELAFISGPANTSTSYERKKGFEEAVLHEENVRLYIENGHYTYKGGYDAAIRLLNNHKNVEGIFCGNDISALGVMDAVRFLGYKVPDDISIVGFDDITMSSWTNYSLTTWKQPVEEMVQNTISILLNEIDGDNEIKSVKSIQGELIVRNSVKDRRNS